jgi:hypothetical protein
MNKKVWEAVFIFLLLVGLVFLLKAKRSVSVNLSAHKGTVPETVSNVPAVQPQAPANSSVAHPGTKANVTDSNELASRAASPNPSTVSGADTNAPPALPPLTVLDKARVVIHNYHDAFGENPVGTNPEITAALKGKNPKQINFVEDSGLRVNDKGEMVDGYGMPFFFHQISGQEMEIRSAGQDRKMWTADDLVTR